MKDQETGQILLQRHLCDGLYQFNLKSSHQGSMKSTPNINPCALTTTLSKYHVNTTDVWHRRLGHPYLNVMRNALKHVHHANIN